MTKPIDFDTARHVRNHFRSVAMALPAGVDPHVVDATFAKIRAEGFLPAAVIIEKIQEIYNALAAEPRPTIIDRRADDLRSAITTDLQDLRATIDDDCQASEEPEYIEIESTTVQTWFERDRAHVALVDAETEQRTIIEWWDDDVLGAIDAGILDPDDYHESAYEHVNETNPSALLRPSIGITVGTDINLSSYALQTGDNSFTGAAYGSAIWGVDTLYRDASDSACEEIAASIVDQILDQIVDAPEHAYPHLATVQDFDRYRDAVDSTLDLLSHVSAGSCPGCEACGLPRPTTDTQATARDPLIFDSNELVGAYRVPDYAIRGETFCEGSYARDSARPLATIDDGFGQLYVYGNETGATHIARADSFESALGAIYDELPTIPESDVPEAYGFETREQLLGADTDTLELCEGYYYQDNSSGTGIVDPGHHEWCHELDRERAVRLRIVIQTDADPESAGHEEFRHSPCEICARPLGGSRSPVHAVDSDGEILHFEACDDCAYFVTYGTLDDQTMIDLGTEPGELG